MEAAHMHQFKKIIVLEEDREFIQWLYLHLLGHSEYRIVSITRDKVLFSILSEEAAALIINGTGLKEREAIRKIREHPLLSFFPVIAYTPIRDYILDIQIVESGADAIIHNPYNSFEMLLVKLHQLINRHKELLNPIQKEREELILSLKKEWFRFLRFSSPFSLIMVKFDLRHPIIRNYEHESVIRYISQLYQKSSQALRLYDDVKNLDYKSFCIVLPASKIEGAKLVGQRIKKLAENLDDHLRLSRYILVGVMESNRNIQDPLNMLKKMEKELLMAPHEMDVRVIQDPVNLPVVNKDLQRIKLLIIDEDPIAPSMLKNYFDPDLFDVQICLDGKKAYDLVLATQPDVVICETMGLELDGFLFCIQIRQIEKLKDMIFIFLSRQTITKHITRGFLMGADDYITKPFSVHEVDARIKRMLRIKGRKI